MSTITQKSSWGRIFELCDLCSLSSSLALNLQDLSACSASANYNPNRCQRLACWQRYTRVQMAVQQGRAGGVTNYIMLNLLYKTHVSLNEHGNIQSNECLFIQPQSINIYIQYIGSLNSFVYQNQSKAAHKSCGPPSKSCSDCSFDLLQIRLQLMIHLFSPGVHPKCICSLHIHCQTDPVEHGTVLLR